MRKTLTVPGEEPLKTVIGGTRDTIDFCDRHQNVI